MYRDPDQRDFARQLRNQPTDPEKRLWWFLCAGKLGCKFRRQAAIRPYIVDFVCFAKQLVIELDGPQHLEAEAKEHDTNRTGWLQSRGFHVIRFRNHELDEGIQLVVESIQQALAASETQNSPPPLPSCAAEVLLEKASRWDGTRGACCICGDEIASSQLTASGRCLLRYAPATLFGEEAAPMLSGAHSYCTIEFCQKCEI